MHSKFFLFIFLFLVFGIEAEAQTHVQTTTQFKTTTPRNIIIQSFSSPSSNGNLIVVHLSWDRQDRTVSSMVDSKGNTYSRINGPTNWNGNSNANGYRSELWYTYNITGGGAAITVTATLNNNATSFFQIYMSEYSGISASNPLDQSRVSIGTAATVSSGTVATVFSNELIYGIAIVSNGNITAGSAFTSRSTANGNVVEDMNASVSGVYSATFTQGSGTGNNWIAEVATFKTSTSLPVELAYFTAECSDENNTSLLKWKTLTEKNNDYFTVERSQDGVSFSEVKRVDGHGTSIIPHNYSITDKLPNVDNTVFYYHLKQTDYNGKFKYSKTVALNCNNNRFAEADIVSFPNPVEDIFNLKFFKATALSYTIKIFDASGNCLYSGQFADKNNDGLLSLNVSSFPSGIYVYELSSGDYFVAGKFSKN